MDGPVLVAGASGFVGRAADPRPRTSGHDVRAMTRRPGQLRRAGSARCTATCTTPTRSGPRCEGCSAAYYLVHSLGLALTSSASTPRRLGPSGPPPAEAGARADRLPRRARQRQGRALRPPAQPPSGRGPARRRRRARHRAARRDRGRRGRDLLGDDPAARRSTCRPWSPRAGSAPAPSRSPSTTWSATSSACWATTRRSARSSRSAAPRCSATPTCCKRVAKVEKRPLVVVPVPLLTPGLSSRWLALVTDVDTQAGRNLVDSMTNEVVVEDDSIRAVVPFEPTGYDEAVRQALDEQRRSRCQEQRRGA